MPADALVEVVATVTLAGVAVEVAAGYRVLRAAPHQIEGLPPRRDHLLCHPGKGFALIAD